MSISNLINIIPTIAAIASAWYAGCVYHNSKKKDNLAKLIGTLDDLKLECKGLIFLLTQDIPQPKFRSHAEVICSEVSLIVSDDYIKKIPNYRDASRSIGALEAHIKRLQEYYDIPDDQGFRYRICLEIIIVINRIKSEIR